MESIRVATFARFSGGTFVNDTFLFRLLRCRLVAVGGSIGRVKAIAIDIGCSNALGGVVGVLPAIVASLRRGRIAPKIGGC